MIHKTFKRFLPMVLAGCFMAAPASFAQGELDHGPVANRVDMRQDRRALHREKRQIVRRKAKLRADVRHFGPDSPQTDAARRQLRRSQRRYVRQARDLRQDRRQAFRR